MENKIPLNVNLNFPNGRQFNVLYRKNDGCFENVGFMLRELNCKHNLILVFSYNGNGKFLLCNFGDGLTEIEYGTLRGSARATVYLQDAVGAKGWKFLSHGIGTMFTKDADVDSDGDSQGHVAEDGAGIVEIVNGQNDIERQFAVSMTTSNVDNSCHEEKYPSGKSKNTENGSWKVGLVLSRGTPRCSAGWNKFVRDNSIRLNDTLVFNLLPDNGEGVVFEVEIQRSS
ncbi:hypothetical protein POM88_012786 [Heracleum sosnowskyi]|uniref:TF-B3 domain-containing protein n=1 Tax=Heracleum sosnowskyi TaxID=360622 RepID=A0AAD8J0Z3_9APIA|nr:hypothetical protein POM88_012786 [Heracleum sosnowskyi]